MEKYIEVPTRNLNRLKAKTPRTGRFWCNKCDANRVGESERCGVCGFVHERRKLKRREIP
jgi:hypothetical protein